jgi:hypothetical protein
MGKAILCEKKELYIKAKCALLEIGIMILLSGYATATTGNFSPKRVVDGFMFLDGGHSDIENCPFRFKP